MPRTTRDGAVLHYEVDEGPRDRPALVFLQGAGLGRWSWRWQREALQGRYRIVAPDTRGTGRSPPSLPPAVGRLPARIRRPLLGRIGHSLSTLVADLEAVLRDAGVTWAHLVGQGLGARLALAYAGTHHRARSVTCLAQEGNLESLSKPFRVRNPHLTDRIGIWREEQDATPAGRAALVRATRQNPDLAGVRVPALVIEPTGADAELASRLEESAPWVRSVDLGADGIPSVEKADEVTGRIETFLADCEAGRAD